MRPVARRLRGTCENTSFEAGSGLLRRRIVDLFEDSRHGKDERRLERLEISQDRLQVAGQAKRNIAGEAEELHVAGEHMRQRKKQQQTTVRLHRDIGHGVDARIGDEHEIRMGELNAFWRSCGAGGVHDGGEVRAFDCMFALLEFGVGHGMAVFDHCVDRAKSDDIDVTKIGAFAPDGFDLVALRVIFRERHFDVGVVEDHFDLRGRIRLVHGNGERADRHDRHVKRSPLPAGVRDDGHRVAGHDALGDQAFGDGDDLVSELGGAERRPLAMLILVFDQGIVRSTVRSFLKHRKNIFVCVNLLFQRPRVFLVHGISPLRNRRTCSIIA